MGDSTLDLIWWCLLGRSSRLLRRRLLGWRWRWRFLPLFLLVADSPSLGLGVSDFAEVKPDGSCAEGVGFWLASIFLVGGPETADEGIEAAPGLAEGAGAGSWRAGVTEEGAEEGVNLGLSELVEVAEEF